MQLKKQFLIFLIIALIAIPGYAQLSQTGTITYTNSTIFIPYNPTASGTIANAATLDFSDLVVAKNVTQIDALFWQANQIVMPTNSQGSTPFFVNTGCVEGAVNGVASYKNPLVGDPFINYTFFQTCTVTNETVKLTLNNNIFSTFTTTANGLRVNSTPLSRELAPIGIRSNLPGASSSTGYLVSATSSTEPYYSSYSVKTYTNYNFTYYPQGFFANISKDQLLPSQIFINQSVNGYDNSPYYSDNAFGFNNVSSFSAYGMGIFLDICFTNSICSRNIINSTNSGNPMGYVNTTPVYATKPSTGVNIVFDKSSYFIGDNVNMSWFWSDSEWNSLLSSKSIFVNLNDVTEFITETGTQSGFTILTPNQLGAYQAKGHICVILCNDVGSASFQVLPPGSSWLALSNTTVISKIPFNATYHVGYSVSNYPAGMISINVVDKSTGNTLDAVLPSVFPDGNVQLGLIHVVPAGNYKVELFDSLKNTKLDSKDLVVVNAPASIPVLNVTTSNITMDKTFYFINDYATITYLVDDKNYTNYSIRADVVNDNTSVTTKQFYGAVQTQIGQFDTLINNYQSQQTFKCERGNYCYFDSGNNHLNLVAYNSTNSIILANYTFFVSTTTVDGWGVILSASNVTAGQQFTVTTIVPVGSTGILKIQDVGYNPNNFAVFNQTLFSGTTKIPVTIIRTGIQGAGYYNVNLYDASTGIIKTKATLIVNPVASTPSPSGQQQANQIVSLLTSNIFWALIITGALMLYIAVMTRDGMATGIVSMFTMGIFTFIGWLPAWIFFTAFIIAALFLASSVVEKQLRNVTK